MSGDLIGIIDFIFTALTFLVFGRALLSWFDPGMRSSIGQMLYRATEPLLAPIRSIMPSMGGIDLSPIVLIIALQILRRLIVQAL